MNGLDLMRVPGLGLAAALPRELMAEPRFDRQPDELTTSRTTFEPNRLVEVVRPPARERLAAACAERLPATPSGKDLARA